MFQYTLTSPDRNRSVAPVPFRVTRLYAPVCLDQNGLVGLPSEMRDLLRPSFFLAKGPDGTLLALPFDYDQESLYRGRWHGCLFTDPEECRFLGARFGLPYDHMDHAGITPGVPFAAVLTAGAVVFCRLALLEEADGHAEDEVLTQQTGMRERGRLIG